VGRELRVARWRGVTGEVSASEKSLRASSPNEGATGCARSPPNPNAVIHINKADTDFWLSQAHLDGAPDSAKMLFRDAAAAVAPYIKASRLATFAGGAELVPGIRSVPIAGHTAGHTGYLVESGGQTMLMWGDVVHLAAMQFADPSVTFAYDSDADQAATDRIAIFNDAARRGYLVASSHVPFPGLGHVRAKGAAFEWVPVGHSVTR